MKVIVTKYHGPTNTKGARISANANGVPRVYISYPHELNQDKAHLLAATTLANKYNWLENCSLIGGGMPDESGNCYVMIEKGTV